MRMHYWIQMSYNPDRAAAATPSGAAAAAAATWLSRGDSCGDSHTPISPNATRRRGSAEEATTPATMAESKLSRSARSSRGEANSATSTFARTRILSASMTVFCVQDMCVRMLTQLNIACKFENITTKIVDLAAPTKFRSRQK